RRAARPRSRPCPRARAVWAARRRVHRGRPRPLGAGQGLRSPGGRPARARRGGAVGPDRAGRRRARAARARSTGQRPRRERAGDAEAAAAALVELGRDEVLRAKLGAAAAARAEAFSTDVAHAAMRATYDELAREKGLA